MTAPRALSIYQSSPHYDKEALTRIDKVYVNGVHLPNCVLYDIDRGIARARDERGNWMELKHGIIRVTMKP